jgi:DNA mismatch repair protein MutS
MPHDDDTPLMRQWREVKARHPDALVFFRVGDFYELFNEDAEEGSRLLGLTLTSRNNGAASRVPLAGVPVKALEDYLARLVKTGRRVAICEQVEDPSSAEGLVRREVTETVTPGTVLADALLTVGRNNYLVAVTPSRQGIRGLAALDLSTGELAVQEIADGGITDELGRLEPSELLLPSTAREPAEDTALAEAVRAVDHARARTYRDEWMFDLDVTREVLGRRYGVQSLEGLGFGSEDTLLVQAAGVLVAYAGEVQPSGVDHIRPPRILRPDDAMVLDEMTRRNLELVEPLRPGAEGGTLLDVIDDTVTAMGARLLRSWLLRPLVVAEEIWQRQESVGELVNTPDLRRLLRERLSGSSDLERLAGKVSTGRVNPRELKGLEGALARLPELRDAVTEAASPMLSGLGEGLDLMEDVRRLLEEAIHDDAPSTLQEGGVIAPGWCDELDRLREVSSGARHFIASLQVRERERTGIGSLRVGYNKVFGYYLEITKPNLDRVPEEYHRKQTLVNSERFFTPELKEWEEKVVGAEERIAALEVELFADVRKRIAGEVGRLQETARRVATLDVLSALAETAERRRYVRPEIHTGFELEIRAGRHPVVETMMPAEDFIPNDVVLTEEGCIWVLTGPNMAGKSTVLRQVGLIQLMAQVGSYVPADAARLPVTDRIFTRVGASDSLARGQSTFMVEMTETAGILHGATDRSLILLDEIGRGTSTYDGVSIAWAVTENLHEVVGAKTIFATHYHELTQLGDLLPRVVNRNVVVKESGEEIVFLRRLEEGGADRSYGIQVARLAGLPPAVLSRARELLVELEGTHSGGGEGLGRRGRHRPASEPPPDQLSFFQIAEPPLLARLRDVDLENMTPLEAMYLLHELRSIARGDG